MASSAMASDGLPRITVLGSLNMDLVSYVSHHPEPGETMTSNGFAVSPGGKGANQAIACAKLSRTRAPAAAGGQAPLSTTAATAHVSMVGAVGDDAHGTALRSNLAAHGVDVSGVQVVQAGGVPSGVAVIVVDEPTGQNRIIFSPGANYQIDDKAGSQSLVPAGTQLLILQLEIPLEQVLRALREARAAGIPVLLNPAPAPATEEARSQLEAAFAVTVGHLGKGQGLAHLVLNETETAALVPALTVADLDTEACLARAAAYFLALGVENVVMTLGGRGVYYASAASASGAGQLLPPEKVARVVDTTGAGDTFAGQYALEAVYATAAGKAFDCAAAVRKSNRAAAKTVQRKGAQDSIPWRDEVE
ncbi:ribokinase [Sporothrix schenckii 1099-18]|uniref:Ribokinase n=1 Tax=Sporothrix schenckii 1099-18 TaxID=1397361 RepID=A0A0F2M7Z0_SPOSC|nr:ribokinase [Sporothrix schenckii 1099-18]KJR85757.1 ribokinase [Sporothrix schenckii 1099-18]